VATASVLGNWAKTFHPRNVGTAEVVNVFENMSQGLSWQESILEGASSLFNFADPLTMCETNCRIGIRITGLFLIPGDRESSEFEKPRSQESRRYRRNSLRPRIRELSSRTVMFGDLRE
jgi:hypothetical protein